MITPSDALPMPRHGLKDELHTGSSVSPATISLAVDTQPGLTLPTSPNLSTPVTSLLPSHFKSLSYDAAAWTWSSNELQEIVSRMIRHSARESFIRLLSLKLLDTILPDELQKLNNQRQTSDKRYRDVVQRRSTLIQGLWNTIVNQTCGSSSPQTANLSISSTCAVLSQLSEIFAECDKLAEGLVQICDQIREIQELLGSHTASALAVALRKLNKSYAKRTEELVQARERISQLEAEKEEAWKEAGELAAKLDTMERERTQPEPVQEQTWQSQNHLELVETPSPSYLPLSPLMPNTLSSANGLHSCSTPSPPSTAGPFTPVSVFSSRIPSPSFTQDGLTPDDQAARPRPLSISTFGGYSLPGSPPVPGSPTSAMACTEESEGCWSVLTNGTITSRAYAPTEVEEVQVPGLPAAFTSRRRSLGGWSVRTVSSNITMATLGTVKTHRTGYFVSSSPLPPLPTTLPNKAHTPERPLPPIPAEPDREPQKEQEDADDLDSDTDSVDCTEEEVSIQTAEVFSVDLGTEANSSNLSSSLIGTTRTLERPTLIHMPSTPGLRTRASVPVLMGKSLQLPSQAVHIHSAPRARSFYDKKEDLVRSEKPPPEGPTDVSGLSDDEELGVDKDSDSGAKYGPRKKISVPMVLNVSDSPTSAPSPERLTNSIIKPPPSKLLVRREARSGKKGSTDVVLKIAVFPPYSQDDTNTIIDNSAPAASLPSTNGPCPSRSLLSLTPTNQKTASNLSKLTPSPSSMDFPVPPPSPSSPSAALTTARKRRSKRYTELNHTLPSPLAAVTPFTRPANDVHIEGELEHEAPGTPRASSSKHVDRVIAARRRSVLTSEESLRLSSKTMELVTEMPKMEDMDVPSSPTPSSATITPRQTNLHSLALDDLILAPSSHGHDHEAQEEKQRMIRRGSVDEISLVANLARRQHMEEDEEVPPVPVASSQGAVSITYYSFLNGSDVSDKQRSKPSVKPVERASTSFDGVRMYTTTPSGGIKGGPGSHDRRFLLNQLGFGIQKWKRMLMSQRGNRGNASRGVKV